MPPIQTNPIFNGTARTANTVVGTLAGHPYNYAGDYLDGYKNPAPKVLAAATTTPNTPAGPKITQGVNDPGTINDYNQSIANSQAGINRLTGQRNAGLANVASDYQNALKTLLGGFNTSKAAYDKSISNSQNDYVTSKNTIAANAGSTLNGILRLLGSRGAGGGSAYNLAAPQAIARQATLQRNDVGKTFAENEDALNGNWAQYNQGYNNSLLDIGSQRDKNNASVQDSFKTSQATLLQSIAQLISQRDFAKGGDGTKAAQPYLDKANKLLDTVGVTKNAPINYQVGAYNSPGLASYTTTPTTPTFNGQQPTNDYFAPALASLLGKKQLAGA